MLIDFKDFLAERKANKIKKNQNENEGVKGDPKENENKKNPLIIRNFDGEQKINVKIYLFKFPNEISIIILLIILMK